MAPKDPQDPLESPSVKATSVRLDESLMQAVQAEAARQGTNPSDFIRQAIVIRIAMLTAARAIQQGVPVDTMSNADAMIQALTDAERRARRRAKNH